MSLTACGYLTFLLLGAELLYLKAAHQFRLFDLPNERSLHQNTRTVRGGGIIVYLAVLSVTLTTPFESPYFVWGLTMVVLVSFLDDIRSISIQLRLFVQLLALGLLLAQTGTFPVAWWVMPGMLVLGIGVLNASNFMDGINGMTALYSLVTVGSLWYLQAESAENGAILYPAVFVALLVFSVFNARPRALCFAGDAGSIGTGFILFYGLLTVVNERHTYLPLLLLAVYGVDTALTLMGRIYRRQPIFRAHRQHLYQRLVSQLGWPHVGVAAGYALVQVAINGLVLWIVSQPVEHQILLAGFVLSFLCGLYVVIEKRLNSQ